MEEFGDWIYILVIIIAGIASLISSMRKKSQQVTEGNRPREIILKNDDEEEVWMPNPEKKPVILPSSKRQVHRSYQTVAEQIKQSFNSYQEGQPALQTEETGQIELEEEYTSLSVDLTPEDTGEWRKAFIYNEIFSRKN